MSPISPQRKIINIQDNALVAMTPISPSPKKFNSKSINSSKFNPFDFPRGYAYKGMNLSPITEQKRYR